MSFHRKSGNIILICPVTSPSIFSIINHNEPSLVSRKYFYLFKNMHIVKQKKKGSLRKRVEFTPQVLIPLGPANHHANLYPHASDPLLISSLHVEFGRYYWFNMVNLSVWHFKSRRSFKLDCIFFSSSQ